MHWYQLQTGLVNDASGGKKYVTSSDPNRDIK